MSGSNENEYVEHYPTLEIETHTGGIYFSNHPHSSQDRNLPTVDL